MLSAEKERENLRLFQTIVCAEEYKEAVRK